MSLTTGGGGYYGYGPKGYVRTDERIREDVCDRLMGYDRLDCSDIEVTAENGEVTLSGTVASRWAKHAAEDIAADVLADNSNYPVLVHCAAGVNRTGAVIAAWRMKYCGWSFEDSIAEAERCGWSPRRNPEMRDHLRKYRQARIVPGE